MRLRPVDGTAAPPHAIRLERGTLSRAVAERSRQAVDRGALSPIETEREVIDDGGVRFVVRRVSTLARKAAQRPARRENARSPVRAFPIELELFVADVSDTHVALLNKFPVIANHLLLVTRKFVAQETLLDRADFAALAACLSEYEALGFYNGGVAAGASEPHKHLQLVPLPLGSDRAVPVESLLDRAEETATAPGLPFRHAFRRCDALSSGADERLAETYRELLAAVGIASVMREGVLHQSAPYNLLVTRGWMLIVPRARERFDGISVNALGYAGSIFVKNEDELARVRQAGPMALLQAVAAS